MTLHWTVACSPCPNDTFQIHGLVHGRIATPPGLRLRLVLADIEELNRRAAGDEPPEICKLSIPALAALGDRYRALPAGAAIGRGVGPLVVRRPGGPRDLGALAGKRVAIPGRRTTANLLVQSFGPQHRPVEMRFDAILDAVAAGDVDAGVVIHEGRFTFAGRGLEEVVDLGTVWEERTGLPLPLAVIAARRDLDPRTVEGFALALRRSVEQALADPAASRDFVAEHAREIAPDVCARHIGLYVNEHSVDIGPHGRAAIDALIARGREAGLLPADTRSPW